MIKIRIDNKWWNDVDYFKFPAGEVGISVVDPDFYPERKRVVDILAHIKNSDDLIGLLMVKDAVDRHFVNCDKNLIIPYFPYARQDRVCNEGESLSVKVITNLVNSMNFKSVTVVDPHSEVTPALINNIRVISQFDIFKSIYSESEWSGKYIVAPDAGAYKKSYYFAKSVGAAGVISCNKIRELSTGKIKELTISDDVKGLDIVVLDDIGDGMGTFVLLAEHIKNANSKTLIITHGIFTKGVEVFSKLYDNVFTTTSYHGFIPDDLKSDNLTYIDIKRFI